MRTFHSFRLGIVLILAVALMGAMMWLLDGGCNMGMGMPAPVAAAPGNRNAIATDVSDDITQDTVWTRDGSPYVLRSNIEVTAGVVLTIEPGVLVQAYSSYKLKVLGRLNAVGTEARPITFTSRLDNLKGQWNGLVFDGAQGEGTGVLQHVIVRHAGNSNECSNSSLCVIGNAEVHLISSAIMTGGSDVYGRGGDDCGLHVEDSRAWVSGTLFLDNGTLNVTKDYALYVTGASSKISVTRSDFHDNGGYAVRMEPTHIDSLVDNVFSGTRGYNRVLIAGGNILTDSALRTQWGLEGYELEDAVVVSRSATLRVMPGVSVLGRDGGELTVRGHVQAKGSPSQPITFTVATGGTSDVWPGLVFDGGTGNLEYVTVSSAGGSQNSLGIYSNIALKEVLNGEVRLAHTRVISEFHETFATYEDYGIYVDNAHLVVDEMFLQGNGNDRTDFALYVRGASSVLTVTGATVQQNAGTGVLVDNGQVEMVCSKVITNGDADQGQGDGINVRAGTFSILGSQIFGNVGYGLRNSSGMTVTAIYNWWGDPAGPGGSGPGSGDEVSDDVLYDDWLTWPAECLVDLAVDKACAYDPVIAGTPLTYTIAVTHAWGPLPATHVVITDTPLYEAAYVTSASSSGEADVCAGGAGGAIMCKLDLLPIGENAAITLVVLPNVDGVLTNTVSIRSDQEDMTGTNDSDVVTTTAQPAVDLSVAIHDLPDPVVVHNPLTYTVVVSNPGPSGAGHVVLTHTWPTTVSLRSFAPVGLCALVAANRMTCTWSTLDRLQDVTATVVVTPEEDGVLASWAEVRAATPPEVAPKDNMVHITTTVEPAADVSLTLRAPTVVYVRDPLTYTIGVWNPGPDDATDVVVTDTLPLSTTYQGGSAGCESVGRAVTCTVGELPVAAQETVTLVVSTDVDSMVITNKAAVSAREVDPDLDNNTGSVVRTVQPQADVVVRAWAAPDPVVVNQPLTYTVVVSNVGPSVAMGVTLTSALPVSVTLGWVTTTQGSVVATQNFASLQLETLAQGASLTVTMGVTPVHDGRVVNVIRTSAVEHDPNIANGSVDVETEVAPASDLGIALADRPDPVYVGRPLTYTIWITNAGPDVATDVRLTDTLPVSLTSVSADADHGGGCLRISGILGNFVKCQWDMMPVSGTATVTVSVRPWASGVFTNHVAVSAREEDPQGLNNVAEEATTVQDLEADISVSMGASRDAVRVGERLTYTVVVTNAGPFPATGVQLTHTLSPALPRVFLASDWICMDVMATAVCTLPMALSEDGRASLQVVVTPTITGSVASRAGVRANEVDANLGNNFAAKGVEVSDVIVDLGVALMAQRSVVGGEPLLYTVVVSNTGDDGATGVEVTQTLPVSVTYTAASPGCQPLGQSVACAVGTLSVDSTIQLTVVVGTPVVSSAVTVTSRAEVWGNEPDAALGNNTDRLLTVIVATPTDSPKVYLPLVLRE